MTERSSITNRDFLRLALVGSFVVSMLLITVSPVKSAEEISINADQNTINIYLQPQNMKATKDPKDSGEKVTTNISVTWQQPRAGLYITIYPSDLTDLTASCLPPAKPTYKFKEYQVYRLNPDSTSTLVQTITSLEQTYFTDNVLVPTKDQKEFVYQYRVGAGYSILGCSPIGDLLRPRYAGWTDLYPIKILPNKETQSGSRAGVQQDHRPQLTATAQWNSSSKKFNISIQWNEPKITPNGSPRYTAIYREKRDDRLGGVGNWATLSNTDGTVAEQSIAISKKQKKTYEYAVIAKYTDTSITDNISNLVRVPLELNDAGDPTNANPSPTIHDPPDRTEVGSQSNAVDAKSGCNCEKISDQGINGVIQRAFCETLCFISSAAGKLACFMLVNVVKPLFNISAGNTCNPEAVDSSSSGSKPQTTGGTTTSPSSKPTSNKSTATPSPSGTNGSGGSLSPRPSPTESGPKATPVP